jgi:hypothetical protein
MRKRDLRRTVQNLDQPLPHLGGAKRRRDVLELERLLQGELEPPPLVKLQRLLAIELVARALNRASSALILRSPRSGRLKASS